MYNFEVMSSHWWWGWLDKFWLAFYHLYDIPNINTKFHNNRSSSFGDYLFNITPIRQTDGNGKPISSYSRGHEKSRKRKSRESTDGPDCNTSFAYAREVKR